MKMNLKERRNAFESFKRRHKRLINELEDGDIFTCPCCGFPTLGERHGYLICPLCEWEDDGQDDFDADRVWGGANSDYSLTEARENFDKYCIMYCPSDKECFTDSIAKTNFKGEMTLDKSKAEKRNYINFL